MALARAELISFVDGDDFVSSHYVQTLYKAYGGVAGRMVKAGFVSVDAAELMEREPGNCFQGFEALEGARHIEGCPAVCKSFLLGEFSHYAWGALLERSLYQQVPFEPGLRFEDIYASADLAAQLSEAVLLDAKLYGYTQRKGSICNPVEPDEQLLRDILVAIRHLEGAVGEWGEELTDCAPVKVAWLYSALCTRTMVFGERAVWETYLGEAWRFVRVNRGVLLRVVRKGVFDNVEVDTSI